MKQHNTSRRVGVLVSAALLTVCLTVLLFSGCGETPPEPADTAVRTLSALTFDTGDEFHLTKDSAVSDGAVTDSFAFSPLGVYVADAWLTRNFGLNEGDFLEIANAPQAASASDKALHFYAPTSSNNKSSADGGAVEECQVQFGAPNGWWLGAKADGSAYALEFDFYADSFSTSLCLRKSWSKLTDTDRAFWFGITANASFVETPEFGITSKDYTFTEGRWYHIAWVAEAVSETSTKLSVYINGEKVTGKDADGNPTAEVTVDRALVDSASYLCFGRSKMTANSNVYVDNLTLTKYPEGFPTVYDAKLTATEDVTVNEDKLTVAALTSPVSVAAFKEKLTVSDKITLKIIDGAGKEITDGNMRDGLFIALYAVGVEKPKTYCYGKENTLTLEGFLTDNAVLQADKPTAFSGKVSVPGSLVTVTVGTVSASATADENGAWTVTLPAIAKRKYNTVRISADTVARPVLLKNVDVGEVWLLGGQSNMDYEAYKAEDADEILALAKTVKNLRVFTFRTIDALTGWSTTEKTNLPGTWYTNPADAFNNVSAIGLVAGLRLAVSMPEVTVAIVDISYSGSTMQTWMSLDTVKTIPNLLTEYNNHLANVGKEKSYWYSVFAYNTIIAPMKGYAARGVLWYQGEGNNGLTTRADGSGAFATYFAAMSADWRKVFGNDGDLPFVTVQLAPYISANYANTRNAQYTIAHTQDNVYLVSTGLYGTIFNELDNKYGDGANNIHTSRKSPIGDQAADLILKKIYGKSKSKTVTAPDVVSITMTGNTVTVTFDSELQTLFGDTPEGFELLNSSGQHVNATASLLGDSVILTYTGDAPAFVRYAYDALVIYCKDGTVIRNPSSMTLTTPKVYTSMKVSYTEGGKSKTYTFVAGTDEAIRSTSGGNLTNESGYPAPSFYLPISK